MAELLEFRDNDTAHDDLHLSFAGAEETADSYYLALDNGIEPDDESPSKARLVLRRLLEQWREHLRAASDGDVLFLPYDFSDQYTGCLRCQRNPTGLFISHGYSSREGWSFNPSDIGDYVSTVDDFRLGAISATGKETEGTQIGFEEFLSLVESSIAAAEPTQAEQAGGGQAATRSEST
jgi:hypothetical protein